jgi:hypothetical protein
MGKVIAALKLTGASGLKTVTAGGSSAVRVGEKVMAASPRYGRQLRLSA